MLQSSCGCGWELGGKETVIVERLAQAQLQLSSVPNWKHSESPTLTLGRGQYSPAKTGALTLRFVLHPQVRFVGTLVKYVVPQTAETAQAWAASSGKALEKITTFFILPDSPPSHA